MTELRAVNAGSNPRTLTRTACEYAALWSSLLLLAAICLCWSLFALPLYAMLPRAPGRALGRYGIMAGFRLYAGWLVRIGAYKLDLSALDALRGGPALILAPNHPSLIDALLILSRHPNLSCVMKSELKANILLGPGARLARYINNDSPLQLVREAVAELRDGGVLLLFPEGTRTSRAPLNALTRSIGVIARRAGVEVQTLLIETDPPFLGKGCPLWSRPSLPITYRVRLGRRFPSPQDLEAFMLELERYYRSELQSGHTSNWDGSTTCR